MLICKYGGRVLIVLSIMLLVAAATGRSTRWMPNSSGRLTAEGNAYQIHSQESRIEIYNDQSGRNNREIYWNERTPESATATVCGTWISGTDIAQNGIAFRIQQTDGGYNAIVLERNIWANMYWVFNVAVFYTGSEYEAKAHADGGPIAKPYDGPAGIDLSSYLGAATEAVYPLRICASLGADDVLRFVVAKAFDPMPPLNNPGRQGGHWQLDLSRYYHAGQGRVGRAGMYAGHIPQGASLILDDIAVTS